jgi:Arc/MetJ family transcription regulator
MYSIHVSKSRTNIEIEDSYLQSVMDRYGLHTKTDAVDFALRHLAGQPMTREEALGMRGAHAILDSPADTGPAGAG